MSDLQNQTPANTYKGLLQVGDYTDGITNNTGSNALQVTDGAGVNTALALSTARVGVGNTSPQAELDVSGGIEATTLTASGAVTAGSVSTSGAVTGGSVSTSGAVTGGSVSTSGAVTGGSVSTSGAVTAGSVSTSGSVTAGSVVATSGSLNLVGTDTEMFAASNGDDIQFRFNGGKKASVNNAGLFTAGDGTRVVPSFRFTDDLDTGMFRPANNEIAFSTASNEVMRIDSDGKVGIGTLSPSAPLEVVSTTGGVIMPRMNNSQRDAISSPTDGEMIFNTSTNTLNVYNGTAWRALTDTAV